MPAVDVTDKYIRLRQHSPSNYIRMRTKTLSSSKGIKAIVGFKANGKSEIQSYLFNKKKWTVAEAKKWVKDHKKGKVKKEDIEWLDEGEFMRGLIVPPFVAKRMINKEQSIFVDIEDYSVFEEEPIYLIGRDEKESNVYGIIRISKAMEIDKDKLEKSYNWHKISGEDKEKLAKLDEKWNGDRFYSYGFNVVDKMSYDVPYDSGGPYRGVDTWVNVIVLRVEDITDSAVKKLTDGELYQMKGVLNNLFEKRYLVPQEEYEKVSDSIVKKNKVLTSEMEDRGLSYTETDLDALTALNSLASVKKGIVDKAKWDRKYVNDLPDSAFAYIESGGEKDDEGKTKPRSLRHLPYKNKNGKIDIAHLRNALARLPQTDIDDSAKKKARRKLISAARAVGVKVKKNTTIMKIDEEKRIVYGVIIEPETFDAQEDRVTVEEIEKACHAFMENCQKFREQHQEDTEAKVVENYIATQDLFFKHGDKMDVVRKGSWVMGAKVYDDEVWEKIKTGEYTGFSIHGFGEREVSE